MADEAQTAQEKNFANFLANALASRQQQIASQSVPYSMANALSQYQLPEGGDPWQRVGAQGVQGLVTALLGRWGKGNIENEMADYSGNLFKSLDASPMVTTLAGTPGMADAAVMQFTDERERANTLQDLRGKLGIESEYRRAEKMDEALFNDPRFRSLIIQQMTGQAPATPAQTQLSGVQTLPQIRQTLIDQHLAAGSVDMTDAAKAADSQLQTFQGMTQERLKSSQEIRQSADKIVRPSNLSRLDNLFFSPPWTSIGDIFSNSR